MGKVIGILSLKGGVGKTSSVIALGDAISKFGKKVLLVDGNFSAPNLGIHLNVIDPDITLQNVLRGESNIQESIYKYESFDIIPSSIFRSVKVNYLKLRDKLKHIRENYDVILVDSSPTLKEETLAVMLASDEILIVTTPDYSTLSTTIKAVKLAQQRGTPISGLVLNKVHNKNFEVPISNVEASANVPVMAVVPHDINILKAQAQFTPVTNYKPKSEASQEYRKLAASLIGEKYKCGKFGDLFRRITPRRQDINREIFYQRVFK
jgi:septum site-determining protein MinD